MPPIAREAIPGTPHHLTQRLAVSLAERGNRRADVFSFERNPVRTSVVTPAGQWAWSSAAAHGGEADKTGLLDLEAWNELLAGADWREVLKERLDESDVAGLRRATARGRPLGSDRFLAKLERALGRRLRPLPVGRPRKRKRKGGANNR